ncbi:unnamed protein product [Gordionus sp. m RMFG-2023]
MAHKNNSTNVIEEIFTLDNFNNYKYIFVPLYIIQIVITLLTNSFFFWTLYDKSILSRFHLIRRRIITNSLNQIKGSSIKRANKINKNIYTTIKQYFEFPVQCYFSLRACGDILSALICLPIQIHVSFYAQLSVQSSNSSKILCKEVATLWYFKEAFTYLSSFSILAIAVNRFQAIVLPLKYKADNKHIKWGISVIILAVMILPTFFLTVKIFDATSYRQDCRLSVRLLRNNFLWFTMTGIIFPFTISIILYSYMAYFLKSSKNITNNLFHNSISNRGTDKAMRLICQLIGAYLICSIPLFGLYIMIMTNKLDVSSEKVHASIHSFSIWFCCLRWINPLLVLANT